MSQRRLKKPLKQIKIPFAEVKFKDKTATLILKDVDEVRLSRLLEDVKKWAVFDTAVWNQDGNGKSNKLLAQVEDTNDDGFYDLALKIEDTDGVFEAGNTVATLSGLFLDGTPFEGTSEICIRH